MNGTWLMKGVSIYSLPNECLHKGRFTERPVVLVGNRSVHVALEEGEHGEPDASPPALLVGAGVGQGVVVEEKARGDIEGDEDVD